MKKITTLLLLGGITFNANAQQINGDFNAAWHNCTPWTSDGNTKQVGAEPEGWRVSNVYAASTKTEVSSCVPGPAGKDDQAVKLTNKTMMSQGIPGYITLGTPWATAEVKGWGDIRSNSTDGGTFGGIDFTYRPDAISFDYQRDNSHGTENATVVAYLWNGTWTQADVPGNTAYNLLGWPTATKCVMTDRDRNVLGKDTPLGGNITKTDDAKLVASVEQAITDNTNGEWKTMTIPFTYADKTAKVTKLNVIFSATDYFGDRNNIVGNNSLTIDNVKLIYNHELSALSTTDTDGNDIALNETFSKDKHDYTVNASYDDFATEVNYTSTGVGATVSTDFNEDTNVLTVTVKAADYDADTNPEAMTVYTIKYMKPAPKLSTLVVAGHEFISAGNESTDFTATGSFYANELHYASESVNAKMDYNYDDATKKLTITVSEDGAISSTVYTITFEGKQKDAVYQIPNSDFEQWASDNSLAESWNSFDSATGLFASFASMSPLPQKIEGYKGNGVRIVSKNLYIANANGNLTTGHINMGSVTPADATNFNFTDRTDVNGNLPFAGKPDAFEVYARFTPGTATTEGTALNGRVQLIMHSDAAYHDPELETMADAKIASANVIIPATAEWTKFTGEFNYANDDFAGDCFLLASATTNPVPGASQDDQLDLDELHLIYYSTLSDLTIGGKTIDGFAPDKYEYTVDGDIKDMFGDVEYTTKSKFAQATIEDDFKEGTVKIYVRGNDYSVNNDNVTVYTINFNKLVDGINTISAETAKNHKVYTLGGVRVSGKPAAGVYVVDGKKTVVK